MYEKTITLEPLNDRAKSFYAKAHINKAYYEHSCLETLTSYDTDVLAVVYHEIDEPTVFKLWGGYSSTTMRHVNEYLSQNGLNGGGKKWWDSLPLSDESDAKDSAREQW